MQARPNKLTTKHEQLHKNAINAHKRHETLVLHLYKYIIKHTCTNQLIYVVIFIKSINTFSKKNQITLKEMC